MLPQFPEQSCARGGGGSAKSSFKESSASSFKESSASLKDTNRPITPKKVAKSSTEGGSRKRKSLRRRKTRRSKKN
jgi:hypothetical protein